MTTPELNFVEAMRAELAAIDPPRRCCRQAETAGLAGALRPRRRATARLVLRLRRRRETQGVAGPTAAGSPGLAGPTATGSPAAAPAAAFDWDTAQEHCRAAYLRGRFLGQFGLHASWRLRRGRGVVTWKSAETMGTFLRLVGGAAALLELEARQVSRSVRGDLNRAINAESANLQRAVAASARQLEAIEALEADGRLAAQPYVVRVVAQGRRDIPEASFTELAERLELHRSAVQRALARIERLALHGGDEVGERPPTHWRA